MALYWLEEPSSDDRRRLDTAVQRLRESGALQEIVDRGRLQALEADPDAEMMIEAAPGFMFSERPEGPMIRDTPKDRATHGYLPTSAGMEAMFAAVGPGIAPGKNLGLISLKQIAPTLTHLMGLPKDILAPDEIPLPLSE